ncbi:MAG: hypothetical protein Q8S21_00400 [Candidatus Paracaedibacteraceae bacterium]|nr:hypothetical protein [Candidatus Paracaedibacteraceae bacterium]
METNTPASSIVPELSRIVDLERLLQLPNGYTTKATKEECDKLAKRFDFVWLDFFDLSFKITHLGNKSIDYKVEGTIKARLAQECSVTLKEVPEDIDYSFDFRVVHPKQEKDFALELSEFEDFEFSSDGIVDLGEIGAQYLYLSIDPYPRFEKEEIVVPTEPKKNPFLVLEKLKKK